MSANAAGIRLPWPFGEVGIIGHLTYACFVFYKASLMYVRERVGEGTDYNALPLKYAPCVKSIGCARDEGSVYFFPVDRCLSNRPHQYSGKFVAHTLPTGH